MVVDLQVVLEVVLKVEVDRAFISTKRKGCIM